MRGRDEGMRDSFTNLVLGDSLAIMIGWFL